MMIYFFWTNPNLLNLQICDDKELLYINENLSSHIGILENNKVM